MKKEVSYLTRPVPLMFIDGPAILSRIPIADDESTSVFVVNEESSVITEEFSTVVPTLHPSIEQKLSKIQTPFGRRIYQPLTFQLHEGEEISGIVEKVEDNEIVVKVDTHENITAVIEPHDIVEIIWRGKSLPER